MNSETSRVLASGDDGIGNLARTLATLTHTLDSVDGSKARLVRSLDLLQRIVPYDRCALQCVGSEPAPEPLVRPDNAQCDRDVLAARLAELLRLVSEDNALTAAASVVVDPHAAERSHLAVPLVGLDQVEGVLFVERRGVEAYAAQDLSVLTVVAAQLATYLTTLRLLENEARSNAELARVNRFQQRLAGMVSHDLRSPLMAVIGNATLIRRRARDERQAKAAARIVSSAERAGRIVDDLLDVTRARSGIGIPVRPRVVELWELIQETIEEFRASHPGRRIELGGDEADAVRVEWDPDRMHQAIGNLLQNALRYGPEDEPVTVKVRAQKAGIILEVQNYGPVIAPNILPHIFDPFSRGTFDKQPGRQGLGLGLYIVRAIVHAHHGEIVARSTKAEGTTFTAILPRALPVDKPTAPP